VRGNVCPRHQHESRDFFSLHEAEEDDPDDMSPVQFLASLGDAVEAAGLIREWPAHRALSTYPARKAIVAVWPQQMEVDMGEPGALRD
jgi:hypothetical protein